MAIKDEDMGAHAHSVLQASNGISLSCGLHSVTGLQLRDQFSCGNDYAPKVRKPYTITKQRERWSEEEHKKFLEALKLYGRAWRRIEEHVGTKTAVQIRSHAQKFFSKVVRDSNGSHTSLEPIEIPPPRPKRKPMHPYPRKLVIATNEKTSLLEQSRRSASPNPSISEQENHSPTSVLSVVGSDTAGSADSDTPSGSLSPVSSAAGVQSGGLVLSEPNQPTEGSAQLSAPALTTVGSIPDELLSTKLDLFPQGNMYAKEGASEEASVQSLKLFGRTLLVTDSRRPSSPPIGSGKLNPSEAHEEKDFEAFPSNGLPGKPIVGNTECTWNHMIQGAHGALCFTQSQQEKANLVQASSGASTPWWTFYGGLPFPFIPFHKVEPSKAFVDSELGEVHEKEVMKEGSWTGSNTGSVNDVENGDKYSEAETQSRPLIIKNENHEADLAFRLRPNDRSAFSELRSSPQKCVKGFVPYKRCIAERDSRSSTTTGEERNVKQIRLC